MGNYSFFLSFDRLDRDHSECSRISVLFIHRGRNTKAMRRRMFIHKSNHSYSPTIGSASSSAKASFSMPAGGRWSMLNGPSWSACSFREPRILARRNSFCWAIRSSSSRRRRSCSCKKSKGSILHFEGQLTQDTCLVVIDPIPKRIQLILNRIPVLIRSVCKC